jgi:hypothetical protein
MLYAFLAKVREMTMPTMPAAWQIEKWKIGRAVLARERELLESGKLGAGNKVLCSPTPKSIKHAKAKIAALDGMIEGGGAPRHAQRSKRRDARRSRPYAMPGKEKRRR